MSTLLEIESAAKKLTIPEQKELMRRLSHRLAQTVPKHSFPVVPATGRPITQKEIDDAFDAD